MRAALLPKLVIAPSFVLSFLFIYGLMAWNGYLSLSASTLLPNYEFVGFEQYGVLFESERWWVAAKNLGIFGGLFIGGSMAVGLLLAILLDQKVRAEGLLRTIYLYPMALSFIVTGTAWKWILNPGLGLEKVMHEWGWTSFGFDWLINPDRAIYTVVRGRLWVGRSGSRARAPSVGRCGCFSRVTTTLRETEAILRRVRMWDLAPRSR